MFEEIFATEKPIFEHSWQTVVRLTEAFFALLPLIIIGVLVFLAFFLGAHIAKRNLAQAGRRAALDANLAKMFASLAYATISLLGLLVASVIIFPTFTPGHLVAGLGVLSIALGIALQDILQNFFAGIMLLWRKPFKAGDEIRTLQFEGTVEEINIRSTLVKTYEGELAIIPNGMIFTNPLIVITAYEAKRIQFGVGIDYSNSIEQARATILKVLQETEGVYDKPTPWAYVAEFGASSINIHVYFWTEPSEANVFRVTDQVATGIKRALDQAEISMPYPQAVVHFLDETAGRHGETSRLV